MATHSSILAWRIPRTEEPGGLQSMGSHKELDTTEQVSLFPLVDTIERKDSKCSPCDEKFRLYSFNFPMYHTAIGTIVILLCTTSLVLI